MGRGLSGLAARLERYWNRSRDNFDRDVANSLSDIIEIAGERDFTPERLRYYKDGTRRFLTYGTDSNYSETTTGHLLEPDADQTLSITTAERSFYAVGNDLWVSLATRLTQAPASGDAVIAGYGDADPTNYDPTTRTWTGTTADGIFGIIDATTGLDSIHEVMVQGGTIVDSNTLDLVVSADTLTIHERRLNWYGVGPSVLRQTFTDRTEHPEQPQQNPTLGAVSNDDGKGFERGSQRPSVAIIQAAGNTGLGLEMGSVGVRTPGPADPNYKTKSHRMSLTTTTTDTWQVVGAIRGDNDRPGVKLRFPQMDVVSTPDTGVTNTRVIFQAVDPANTDADAKTFSTPPEHSVTNSVLEMVEDNSITGPVEDDANTDIDGATTANTMSDPGGYQVAYDAVDTEGTGSKTTAFQGGRTGNRELYDMDIALILAETATAGSIEIDVVTQQNS